MESEPTQQIEGIKLKRTQRDVYEALMSFADADGQNIDRRIEDIAERADCSTRHCQRIIQQLVQHRVVFEQARRPGKTTIYRIELLEDYPRQNVTPDILSPLTESHGSTHDKMSPLEGEPRQNVTPPKTPKVSKDSRVNKKDLNTTATAGKKKITRPAVLFNPYKDAVLNAYGWTWKSITGFENGQICEAAAQLFDINFPLEDIPALIKYCRERYDKITPPGCMGHVSEWRQYVAPKRTQNGHQPDTLVSQWDTDNEPIVEGVDYT